MLLFISFISTLAILANSSITATSEEEQNLQILSTHNSHSYFDVVNAYMNLLDHYMVNPNINRIDQIMQINELQFHSIFISEDSIMLYHYKEGIIAMLSQDYNNAKDHFYQGSTSVEIENKVSFTIQMNLKLLHSHVSDLTGDLDQAIEDNLQVVKLANEWNCTELKGIALNNIGTLYSDNNDNQQSILYLKRALTLVQESTNTYAEETIAGNIAEIYFRLNELDSARSYLYAAQNLNKESHDTLLLVSHMTTLANINISSGDYKTAQSILTKSLNTAKTSKNPISIYESHKILGNLYVEMDDYNNASKHYSLAYQNILPLDTTLSAHLLQKISQCQLKLENTQTALTSIYEAQRLWSSTEERSKKNNADYINMKVEVDSMKTHIERIHNQKTNIKSRWITSLCTYGLLSTLFGLLLIYYYIIKPQLLKNKKISNLQNRIDNEPFQDDAIKTTLPDPITKDKSSIDNKESEILTNAIVIALEKDKLYLDKNLTLETFSKKIGSNRSYVSKIINQSLQKSFASLIKEYRVKEVLKMIENNVHEDLTLEAISSKAGFKSKSTFQRSFKEIVGITPSQFIKLKN